MAEVIVTEGFKRRYRSLAKKFRSLEEEILVLIGSLEQEPIHGTPLGQDCFKIRLSIKSKGGGKSGGGRVITYVRLVKNKVYLLTIYDKSDKSTLSPKELRDLIASVGG